MSNEGALATLDPVETMAEIAAGTLTKDIAARYGVSKQAVRARIKDHPGYPEAIESQCESLLEDAKEAYFDKEQFEKLNDALVITRTRDKMNAAINYAKVICPNRFNAKPANITVNNNIVNIDSALGDLAGSLLDKLRTVSDQPKTEVIAASAHDDIS